MKNNALHKSMAPWLNLLLLLAWAGCQRDKPPAESAEATLVAARFELLDSAQTGVSFANRVVYSGPGRFDLATKQWYGAGVAVGDVNNDRLIATTTMHKTLAGHYYRNAYDTERPCGHLLQNDRCILHINQGNNEFAEPSEVAGAATHLPILSTADNCICCKLSSFV